MNQQIINEIKSSNDSRPESKQASKPDTPKLYTAIKPPARSFSTDVNMTNNFSLMSSAGSMMRMSPRDTPRRKYFDSGDYELAKVGIVSSASIGSLHPNPETINSCSRSGSSHYLQPFIITNSREELLSCLIENESNLKQTSFSLDDLAQ